MRDRGYDEAMAEAFQAGPSMPSYCCWKSALREQLLNLPVTSASPFCGPSLLVHNILPTLASEVIFILHGIFHGFEKIGH